MPYLLNLVYLVALVLASPWLCYKALTTGKYRRGMVGRLLGRSIHPLLDQADARRVVWFHGVSVGEIHLLRPLIARFRERFPEWRCVVSTTTDTGREEALKCFPDLAVIDWPFDFTWAVRRALATVRPELVVLAEGEIWPNFVRAAAMAGVRLAVVNGRLSPRSAARYGKVRWLLRGIFGRIDCIGAQTEDYRRHFESMGARAAVVTGNVKYDGVAADRSNPRTRAMAELFGIRPGEVVLVAGSTQDPEERLCLDFYARARVQHPDLRLIVVPRHRERFGEVAACIQSSGLPLARRSALRSGSTPPGNAVILVDTIGELAAVWGLADIAFVGGSLDGKRGGQNMIEPAAYGAAVLFGPYTWNFRDTVTNLLSRDGAIQVADGAALEGEVMRLLADKSRRQQLGLAARAFVLSQQGATERTFDLLERLMGTERTRLHAA